MCRLFGFRSVISSQVHRSLVNADNALAAQSERHPDGWGVAYYVDEAPHVTRSADTALNDHLFRRVSGVVSSQTVLAHVRKATVGELNVLNCHPFQHGRWTFAHNGDIPEFARCRDAIEAAVAPRLRPFILGDTDSERIFFLFLTHLSQDAPLSQRFGVEVVSEALSRTVQAVRAIADVEGAPSPALLTLMVTDGLTMAAVRWGKELYWSTHKGRCADRDLCPHFADVCEAPTTTGFVNHLIMSSEPVIDENVWEAFGEGEIVGVDWRMRVSRRFVRAD
ncbi:MAG: class II glutamine amidotransferase [Deltaproteobacteria bacterium]|nr:class II glutamine amidotransferase [Deltaproteobacteria bacterium]MCB9788146.1 class II glutamine amidotransferase [Deltaproteobacteria bacterium]